MSKQCCGNCVYAEWALTGSGRISRHIAGWCMFSILVPLLPANATMSIHRCGIWPKDGADCETFQAKEGAK